MFPTTWDKFGENWITDELNGILLVKKVKNCQFSFVFWLPSNEISD